MSAINASNSGVRACVDKVTANSQNLAAAGAVAGKERVVFITTNSVGGDLSNYTPAGVKSSGQMLNSVVGTSIQSQISTHCSLDGQGYFVVNSKADGTGATSFSRVGTFAPDQNGNFVNSVGQYLMVQPTNSVGKPSYNDISTLAGLKVATIQGITGTPQATDSIIASLTLPAQDAVGAPPRTRDLVVIDALGVPHSMTITWTKTAEVANTSQTWKAVVTSADATSIGAPYAGPGGMNVQFDSSGNLMTINGGTGAPPNMTVTWNGAVANSVIAMNLGTIGGRDGIACAGDTYDTGRMTINGFEPGRFQSTSIDENGFINVSFDNNTSKIIARIPVATFNNPNKLSDKTGGINNITTESGGYKLTVSGENGAGAIKPGTIEGSTIDSSSIFTRIIIDQNENMGNLQAIKAVNEMLKDFQTILR